MLSWENREKGGSQLIAHAFLSGVDVTGFAIKQTEQAIWEVAVETTAMVLQVAEKGGQNPEQAGARLHGERLKCKWNLLRSFGHMLAEPFQRGASGNFKDDERSATTIGSK